MGALLGQQGISSGMPIAVLSTIAVCPFGKAIAGLTIGATARPIIARMLSNRPMADRLIIVLKIPIVGPV
jgi:hypothetical protein